MTNYQISRNELKRFRICLNVSCFNFASEPIHIPMRSITHVMLFFYATFKPSAGLILRSRYVSVDYRRKVAN